MRFNFVIPILLMTVCLPIMAQAGPDEDMAQQLLYKALENQYRGRYQAKLELIEESFARGRDSLTGQVEFADDLGERRISLAGSDNAFEYQCLNYGKEQWVTDGKSRRIRRIANRQWKKGVFGNLLTYEDMLKFPMDFLLEYSSCQGVKATDSAYHIGLVLKPAYQSFYSRLEVTLSKEPVLLRSMTFYGFNGQKLKSMEVTGYKQVQGRYLVSNLSMVDCDSTASLQMCFKNWSFEETPDVRSDKPSKGGVFSLFSRLTDIMPKGPEAAAQQRAEEELEAN